MHLHKPVLNIIKTTRVEYTTSVGIHLKEVKPFNFQSFSKNLLWCSPLHDFPIQHCILGQFNDGAKEGVPLTQRIRKIKTSKS